jgi:putative DNA primase/helicase
MDLHGHELIHCTERRSYYVWAGQRWQFDEFVEVEERAEETMLGAFADASHIADSNKRAAFLRFVNRPLSRTGLTSMMHLAKKKVRQASTNDFDRDPWLLNVANGTADLRTCCRSSENVVF